jgi:transcription factor MBP1
VLSPDHIERLLNEPDHNGDTAITIAARNGARKCVRSLIGRNAAVDIPNNRGETADQLILQLNARRQERDRYNSRGDREASSSPFQEDRAVGLHHATLGGAVQPPNGIPFSPLTAHTNGGHTAFKSAPALALTSSLLPSLTQKTTDLARALETSLLEKDVELAEAERLVALRKAEIAALQRQREELHVKELEQTSGFGEGIDEKLIEELEKLERECENLIEEEQGFAVSDLLKLQQQLHNNDEPPELPDKETALAAKLNLSRELLDVQKQRRTHVKQIVQHLARLADGMGSKQRAAQYRKLITGALGLGEKDAETVLPDIVAELEEWKGME